MMLVLDLGVDGMTTGLGIVTDLGSIILYALLESLDRTTEVAADVAQLFSAKNKQHDDQNDQPMPNAKTTHGKSPLNLSTRNGIAPAKYVYVNMKHFLSASTPGVDQCLETRVKPQFLRQTRRQQQHFSQQLFMLRGAISQCGDVQFRDDQNMYPREWMA
jgi:hypothetical protein